MSATQQHPPTGFSLFPSPNSSQPPSLPKTAPPRPRRSESRERRAPTPQALSPDSSSQPAAHRTKSPTPPRAGGRQTPQLRMQTPATFVPPQDRVPTWPLDDRRARERTQEAPVQQGRQAADVPGRTGTAFSEANTLVRSNSGRSRSSIAKLPLPDDSSSSQAQPPQPLRSIFPTYNPDVPLDRQDYLPTQMSPSRIPRAVISRQTYHGELDEEEDDEVEARGHPVVSPIHSPETVSAGKKWPPRQQREAPAVPKPSSTEQLKSLWKVANGWKASASEGRVYCLKLSQEQDAPVYQLSSSSAVPFYSLRMDPTSASAYVTMTRHDPSKPYKGPKPGEIVSSSSSVRSDNGESSSGNASKAADTKNWQEALTTTLEEEQRKHRPNDGLVALLMPSPATKMALERADDPQAVFLAEKECARLVWDDDSASHFLVHPALARPFCVTVERSPAWSRTEYTLEHHESPQHIAKLTRDGTGGGWLEIDTGIASKIESFFITDVAVTALLLVAAADDRSNSTAGAPAETFAPPPAAVLRDAKGGGRLSKLGWREDKKTRSKMEEFEIDIESQDENSLRKGRKQKPASSEEKLPFVARAIVKVAKGFFHCFIWVLTVAFKCFGLGFKALYKCFGSKY